MKTTAIIEPAMLLSVELWDLQNQIAKRISATKSIIVQCVDLSKEKPAYSLDVKYLLLFGKGQHNIYNLQMMNF